MTSTLTMRVKAATKSVEEGEARATGAASPDQERDGAEQYGGGQPTEAVMAWLEKYSDQFAKALPKHIDPGPFFAAVREVLPSLAGCTRASLLQATLTCARFGLIPDGTHAVIKADGPTATFVPMYQGYVQLMLNSGRVASVHVGMIHAGDEWRYTPTAPVPKDFHHEPALEISREQRGKPILAYAFCWMHGGARSQVVLLTREDAEDIRDEYSEAYQRAEAEGRKDSFWHLRFDDMWLKSGLRQLYKLVPKSPEVLKLSAADDAGDAGRTQILHAPDEAAQLRADAEAAQAASEGSQEPRVPQPLPRKKSGGRQQPKRTGRKGRKAELAHGKRRRR